MIWFRVRFSRDGFQTCEKTLSTRRNERRTASGRTGAQNAAGTPTRAWPKADPAVTSCILTDSGGPAGVTVDVLLLRVRLQHTHQVVGGLAYDGCGGEEAADQPALESRSGEVLLLGDERDPAPDEQAEVERVLRPSGGRRTAAAGRPGRCRAPRGRGPRQPDPARDHPPYRRLPRRPPPLLPHPQRATRRHRVDRPVDQHPRPSHPPRHPSPRPPGNRRPDPPRTANSPQPPSLDHAMCRRLSVIRCGGLWRWWCGRLFGLGRRRLGRRW